MKVISYDYSSVPTINRFRKSKKRIKAIIGCLGSGKSSGCVMHLLESACEQMPHPADNVRYTRYVIVRNTRRELRDTTKKTIDEWLSPLNPVWRESEDKYTITFKLEDGTIVNSEWLLRSLDEPKQARDLLSMEISGAWLNEARELSKYFFDIIEGRIGRFPRRINELNYGCSYPFVIMDSNPPDVDSWLYKMFEEDYYSSEELREKIELFKQPSGLSPEAENLDNLPPDYYKNLMIGKDEDFIRVYIHGEYGFVKEGKVVFPNFIPSIHVSKEELRPRRDLGIIIGMDFGLFPACVITQLSPLGELYVLDEVVSFDAVDVKEFTQVYILPLLYSPKYRMCSNIIIIGDPAGASRSQLDSRTCFSVLHSMNLRAYPAYTNALQPRLQVVNQFLTRMIKGKPAFQISPTCPNLIKALSSKYVFRRLRVAWEKYSDIPDKNEYSHVADALQYACLGYTPSRMLSTDFQDTSANKVNKKTILGSRGYY